MRGVGREEICSRSGGAELNLSPVSVALEDHSAAIAVRLNQIVEAGVGQQFFQAQSLLQSFRDVQQGQLGFAEDINARGVLEPFKASVTIVPVSSGSNVTDAFGKAYFTLQYGENYASWEDIILTFTTTVEGTEGHASYSSSLPVPANVLTNTTADPPFKYSPYNVISDPDPTKVWIAGRTPVTNPGVIYPQTLAFNLCQLQP